MISEWSCDTEDWSNSVTQINDHLKYIQIKTVILNCNKM